MDIRLALREQYHAGLAMLREAIELCPDELWLSGEHPRTFWRIAYHAIFYTHLYLGQDEDAFARWAKHRNCASLWEDPPVEEPFSRQEVLEYLRYVDELIDPVVDGLDLDAEETGFSWYKDMTKLSHQLMNIRHLQGHVGQASELLMAQGIDIDWIAKAEAATKGL